MLIVPWGASLRIEQAYANYVTDMLLESDVDESSTTTTKELKI